MAKKPDDQYSPEESKERMMAALRGARIAGHMPMENPIKKRAKGKKAKSKKKTAKEEGLLNPNKLK